MQPIPLNKLLGSKILEGFLFQIELPCKKLDGRFMQSSSVNGKGYISGTEINIIPHTHTTE